jgi:beta-glucosidase
MPNKITTLLFCLLTFAISTISIVNSSNAKTIETEAQVKKGKSNKPKNEESIDKKVSELLAKMTLEEKIGQLEQQSGNPGNEKDLKNLATLIQKGGLGSILNIRGAKYVNQIQEIALKQSRLQIPIIFGFDVIQGYRTIFPVPLAQASSWDLKLIEDIETIAAREATAAGIKWTFSPMVDIARDPRWGRIVEGAGEDPYLGTLVAEARVRGFQGTDLAAPDRVMACAKHWVGYGAAEGGRDYNTTLIPENELRSVYFPPFKAALDAGVGSFMSAFNDLNGVPASSNNFTLNKVLRQEWGFKGFVVSDWASIKETITHGYAATEEDAARMSFLAGVDMEMASELYQKYLPGLVTNRKVTEEQINRSVRRILTLKYRLGLFDNPYIDETKEQAILNDPKHIQFTKEASIKTQVLLKNKNNLLPLSKNVKSIAVIGPLADDQDSPLGWWRGDGRTESVVTILKALQQKVEAQKRNKTEIFYSAGCTIKFECSADSIQKATETARKADVVILVVGEHGKMSGEANSRSRLDLPGQQQELVESVNAVNPNTVVVLVNGRPLAIPWIADNVPAILETWLGGQQAGPAVADVLFGDANPGGKLTATWPRSVGQLPVYYNHKNSGRPADENNHDSGKYTDEKIAPLFPFGFGLSYTQFKITNLKLSSYTMKPSEKVTVSVDVENIGAREGSEVVQLYIHDVAASITRPVKELKAFKKISLNPKEKQTVEFQLGKESFSFIGQDMKPTIEAGDIEIFVGNSSDNVIKSKLTLVD